MRIVKGKVVLDKRDRRVGNFVYTVEKSHVKVQDINGSVSHRVAVSTARGSMLEMLVKEGSDSLLEAYAVCMYNALGVIFDADYLMEVNEAAARSMERHKDLYRQRVESEEADAEALEAVKAVEEIRETLERESEGKA